MMPGAERSFWTQPEWIALYTKPRAEKQVYQRLLQRGLEAYLPLIRQLRQWSDRKKWIEVPLFSSYVFVRVDRKSYEAAVRTYGVVRCVWFNGRPAFIPASQIEAIRRFIEGNVPMEVTNSGAIQPGDWVEIEEGPFRGIQGEVVQVRGKNRFVIRIDAIGAALSVECEGWQLRKLERVSI